MAELYMLNSSSTFNCKFDDVVLQDCLPTTTGEHSLVCYLTLTELVEEID